MKQLMHSIRHMEDSMFESIEFHEFDLGRPKCYCANPKTVNTRIIFGILLCCEEKPIRCKMEKPQGATIISFVACGFFLWFAFASDWSSHN